MEKPKLAKAPYQLTRPCPRLLALPRKEHDQEETEAQFTADEAQHNNCRNKHLALVRWYAKRDAMLMGEPWPPKKKARSKAKAKPVTQ